MENLSTDQLLAGIRSGNKRLLGKAITLVESKKNAHRAQTEELLQALMPFTGNSLRIGVTGVPGAGKSTFIENFGKLALRHGKKVAVLAIDPSSALNKGSILGDKTRMEELAREENAFIRPSPSSGFLGGVANSTFESMLVCEAAGYDYILIETVGVGQSEILVSEMTDVFLYLKITGGGDELQGIKRGIMEMVDVVFINKAEGENLAAAKKAKVELLRALHFMPSRVPGWKVPVLLGSALRDTGLQDVYQAIASFVQFKADSGLFAQTRREQAEKRFQYWVNELIINKITEKNTAKELFEAHKNKASALKFNPYTEAKNLVKELFRDPSIF